MNRRGIPTPAEGTPLRLGGGRVEREEGRS